MMRTKTLLLLTLSMFLLMACKPKTPAGILSESDMEDLLYDYHLAQCAAEANGGDINANRYLYIQAVFKKHHITEEKFDKNMDWFSGHAQILTDMYKRLNERYAAEASSIGVGITETERMANLSETGDTANIWPFQRVLFLHNDPTNCLHTLSISADSTFLPGDKFKLSFYSHFQTANGSSSLAFAFLTVNFLDGNTASVFSRIGYEGSIMMVLPEDAISQDSRASRISVTFYYPLGSEFNDASYFYINTPALVRIHKSRDTKPKEEVDTLQHDEPVIQIEEDSTPHKLDHTQPKDLIKEAPAERDINIVKEKKYAPLPKHHRRRY